MSIFDEAIVLNDGSLIPKVGVQVDNDQTLNEAVAAGFRLIEQTADQKMHMRKTLPQLFMETVISEDVKTREELRNYFATVRANLISSRPDLCLLKLSDDQKRNQEIWHELEEAKCKGWVKCLGVADATTDSLGELLKEKVKPVVMQLNYEDPVLINLAREHKMQVEISIREDIDALAEIATKYKVSVIDLVISYFNQKRIIPLIEADAMKERSKADVKIQAEDMEIIGQLFASN